MAKKKQPANKSKKVVRKIQAKRVAKKPAKSTILPPFGVSMRPEPSIIRVSREQMLEDNPGVSPEDHWGDLA